MATKKVYITVRHSGYHVRKEANKNSDSLYVVKAGEKIVYLGEIQNGWYHVSINRKKGWLYKQAGDVK